MNFQKPDSHAIREGVNNLLANVKLFKGVFAGSDFIEKRHA